jgi:hypothetical protein
MRNNTYEAQNSRLGKDWSGKASQLQSYQTAENRIHDAGAMTQQSA